VTVRNVPSLRLLAPPSVLQRRNTPRKVLYHGMYLPHRGLEQLITAAQYLDKGALVLRGLGPQEPALRKLAADLGLAGKVQFMPPVPVDDLVGTAAECDIGINPFLPAHKNMQYCLPNKFFEYMAGGLAVVSSDLIELRGMTRRHELGVLLDSVEPRRMAGALSALLADPARLDAYRRNAYEAARTEYHWEKEQAKLTELYAQACAA
jgi:glycosyltransferase involved in cell wall biosynthesis